MNDVKKLIPCIGCKNIRYCPIHVTDIQKDKVVSYSLCVHCGEQLMQEGSMSEPEESKPVDLEHVNSPEQLLDFIFGNGTVLGPMHKEPCPKCGLTVEEFDEHGRFGCQYCYEHFHEAMEHMVFPYHGANQHVGKVPKNWKPPKDLAEELKVLKLKKARALEHEKYEEAAQLRREIEQLQKELD